MELSGEEVRERGHCVTHPPTLRQTIESEGQRDHTYNTCAQFLSHSTLMLLTLSAIDSICILYFEASHSLSDVI